MVGQLVLVPIFLAAWGEVRYGEWLTLSAMAAQIALVDFGVQTYVVNRLNQSYSRGELGEYTRILHSALFWSLCVSAVAFVATAAAIFLLPLNSWFSLELTGQSVVTVVGSLLALQVVASIPYGLITGIYRTVGEFPTGTMIYNLQRVVFFALTGAALLLGGGLIHVAAAQLIPLLLGVSYALWDLRRRHPDISIGVSERESGLAQSFLGPSSLFFLIRSSQAASIQGTTLIVSAFFGSAAVALFVTLRTLCNLVRQISNSLITALWPELTSLEASGDFDTLRSVFHLANKVITSICLAAAVFLFAAGQDLVAIWTNGEVSYQAGLMNALLVMLVLQTPWLLSSTFLMATNRHKLVSACYILSSLLGLALGAALATSYGIPGLIVGLLSAELLVCGWAVPNAACQLVRESTNRYFQKTVAPMLPVAALAGASAVLTATATDSLAPLLRVSLIAAAVGLASLLATYTLWLNDGERVKVRQLVDGLIKRAS